MPKTAPAPHDRLRRDAARNEQRIVEVAARLLAQDPATGMHEVAEAAGVGRATVYRHFATRDALLQTIWTHAMAEWEAAIEQCRLDEGTAPEALGRLTRAWLEISVRYSFSQLVLQTDFAVSPQRRRQQRRIFTRPLLDLIRRGQASGELTRSVSPEWAMQTFGSLMQGGARAIAAGELRQADAPDIVLNTLLNGLTP